MFRLLFKEIKTQRGKSYCDAKISPKIQVKIFSQNWAIIFALEHDFIIFFHFEFHWTVEVRVIVLTVDRARDNGMKFHWYFFALLNGKMLTEFKAPFFILRRQRTKENLFRRPERFYRFLLVKYHRCDDSLTAFDLIISCTKKIASDKKKLQ